MGELTDADLANGLEMTLAADSADELQNKIAQQAVLLKIAEMAHPGHLENLSAALGKLSPELSARLVRTTGGLPYLRVTNTAVESFAENITMEASAASTDPGHYVWSWGQPIGSAADPESAAAAVSRVLAVQEQKG